MIIKDKIPDITKEIKKEELLDILVTEYSKLGPIWVKTQLQWMDDVYRTFKDHDKFLIIIYLIKKTLDFYSRSFVKLTYDRFYQNDSLEIGEFNITEISKELNIPKETARRKINELENLGTIKRIKKKIIIDRSSFDQVKPEKTIKRISRFLTILAGLCLDKKILSKELTSEDLEIIIKNNFSYIWKIYYEMQIPMMTKYKSIFLDLETFHIYGICAVNQHTYIQPKNAIKKNRDDYFNLIISQNLQGMNAMSISDISGIPRATVIRKLQALVKRKNLTIDDKKHYRLSGNFVEQLKPLQKSVLNHLANFSTKVFNSGLI